MSPVLNQVIRCQSCFIVPSNYDMSPKVFWINCLQRLSTPEIIKHLTSRQVLTDWQQCFGTGLWISYVTLGRTSGYTGGSVQGCRNARMRKESEWVGPSKLGTIRCWGSHQSEGTSLALPHKSELEWLYWATSWLCNIPWCGWEHLG